MTEPSPKIAEVKKVLWQVLILNLLVAGLKIAVGLAGGILSMVADGFHSMMDGSSNIIGLAAMRVASAPPDDDHPYGHRKAETLASLFIGILLLFAAYEILKNAIDRLSGGAAPEVTTLSFAVMIATVLINLGVTLYEGSRGKVLQSEILVADSLHTRTDIWVSLSVIAGLAGVKLGFPWLDAGVGLVIAGIIGFTAVQILRQTGNVLMDQAQLPSGEIERLVLATPGVESVEHIRSRGRADEAYVDLHVRVKPDTPVDYAHSIAHAVQQKIKTAYPQATDVTIHIEPSFKAHAEHPDVWRQLEAIAHSLGGSAHEIWLHSVEGNYYVELHFEVPPTLTLAQAHDLASQLEERGKQALPQIAQITTHIEPMGETVPQTEIIPSEDNAAMLEQIKSITDEVCQTGSCHEFKLWPDSGQLTLSLHCHLNGDLSIGQAHAVSQQVEETLRRKIPSLKRVVVHVEPLP